MSKIKLIFYLTFLFLFQSCNSDWNPQIQYPNLEIGEYWIDIFDQRGLQNAKIVGDKLFCNTINFDKPDYLYCLSLSTGKVIWKYPINHYASQPIIVFDDSIFFSTYLGEITKISLDGEKLWERKFPSSYAGHEINPINGNLFVNSVVNGVYEFDNETGELIYHYKFDNHKSTHHYTMPIVYESNLIFGNTEIDSLQTESFISIDYDTKKRNWESNLNKSVRRYNKEAPLLKKYYLISIEEHQDSIHCIDTRNGDKIWSQGIDKKTNENWSFRYRIENDKVVYHKGDFIVLNLKTGAQETVNIKSRKKVFPILKDNIVYEVILKDKLEKSDLEITVKKV